MERRANPNDALRIRRPRLALAVPFSEQKPWLFAIPGCAPWLLMLKRLLVERIATRHIAEKQ